MDTAARQQRGMRVCMSVYVKLSTCCCLYLSRVLLWFLSLWTFLFSTQRRGKGGNSDMEPIDKWLITQGMIPVAQSSVMDDIEEWLSTDVKGDELEEGVTSEEFDKFLEERAKAAEMVPNLPSPPLEAPTPPTNPSSRKKQERSEDALFAL
ncbi:TOM1-like protein 2 isoform X1 [Meleagris gallopavo]|uniref:TOM1-like protein 2 isoform X1 n=1 Tax=Meleagris gallopavo TaxID=9103 RepID=UPI00054994D8|nr:TOM1-like protein 2 isoform X1 [Meleagris gallopavo]